MKDNWLKDVHDKMAGYEADEPSGLWDDICRARRADTRRPARTARLVRMWSGGVAAAAAVAGIVCLLVPRNDGNGGPTVRPVATATSTARALTPPPPRNRPCLPRRLRGALPQQRAKTPRPLPTWTTAQPPQPRVRSTRSPPAKVRPGTAPPARPARRPPSLRRTKRTCGPMPTLPWPLPADTAGDASP